MTLRTLNYGNYGIFLVMGNAGFCPSTVSRHPKAKGWGLWLSFSRWAARVLVGSMGFEGVGWACMRLELNNFITTKTHENLQGAEGREGNGQGGGRWGFCWGRGFGGIGHTLSSN